MKTSTKRAAYWLLATPAAAILCIAASVWASNVFASPIDHESAPPADWPKLEPRLHELAHRDFVPVCLQHFPPQQCIGMTGFVLIRWHARKVDVYFTNVSAYWHEEQHWKHGRDHRGESTLRDAWARYKAMLDPASFTNFRGPW